MTLTQHGAKNYAVQEKRAGIALCLSGGGFRAALFHLGALRRLNELGILRQLDTITAVSGGSTIAAHLARYHNTWNDPDGCDIRTWEKTIAAPFREIASRNLSTPSVLWGLPFVFGNQGVDSFARACGREFCDPTDIVLRDLPEKPNFQFCATELVDRKPVFFDRNTAPDWPVGRAVAISSAFPLVFWPYRQSTPRTVLVDGGVADNRGLEPVWQTHRTLLVSDGGDVLRPGWSQAMTYSLTRSVAVVMMRMNEMQKRWLIAMFESDRREGTFWGIGSTVGHYRDDEREQFTGYGEDVARDYIATIRLKYDSFSTAEAAILENHGYLLADGAIKRHARTLAPAVDPPYPPLNVPHPLWLDDTRAREALANSASSSIMGHGWVRACWRTLFGARPRRVTPTTDTVRTDTVRT
jgi:NTE family protein